MHEIKATTIYVSGVFSSTFLCLSYFVHVPVAQNRKGIIAYGSDALFIDTVVTYAAVDR